jgi:uncharacterized protein
LLSKLTQNLIVRWVRFVSRRRWIVAVITLAVTAWTVHLATDLKLQTNLAALLPDDATSVRALEDVKQKVGGLGNVIILIESPDSLANDTFARDLIVSLESNEQYGSTEYQRDMSYFDDRKLLFLSVGELNDIRGRVRKKVRYEMNKRDDLFLLDEPDPGFNFDDIEARLETEYKTAKTTDSSSVSDGTSIVVRAYPLGTQENIGFTRRMVAGMRELVNEVGPTKYHPQMEVLLGGQYLNRIVEYEVIRDDIMSSGVIALLGVMLIITIYFRQAFAWLFVGLPLVMGMAWTFGITAVVIGSLNLITGFLVAVLAGLGIDFGIHAFARYIENRNGGDDPETAMIGSLQHTGSALATTAMTTAVAFYSLLLTDFKGFSEFGFIAATGIVLSLIAVYIAFPAFVFIGERLRVVRFTAIKHESTDGVRGRIKWSRAIVIASAILSIIAVVLLPSIEFLYDFGGLRANLPEHQALKQRIYRVTTDPSNPVVIVVSDKAERRAIAEIVRQKAEDPSSLILNVKTIETLVPDSQAVKLRILASIRRMMRGRLEDVLKDSRFTVDEINAWLNPPDTIRAEDVPEFAMRRFRGVDGSLGEFVAIYPEFGLTKGDLVMQFADEIRTVTTDKATYNASGSAVIFADMLILMINDSRTAIILTLAVVFLILLAHFRGLRTACIVLAPVIGGMLWMCGIMVVFGIKLNVYNMVVLPAILGIGVDNGVHLYHRYREEGRGSVSLIRRNTGGPVLMTTLTTMVGFGGMALAQHQGLRSIGELALIGMSACLITSLVFMPALLQFLEDRSAQSDSDPKADKPGMKPETTAVK